LDTNLVIVCRHFQQLNAAWNFNFDDSKKLRSSMDYITNREKGKNKEKASKSADTREKGKKKEKASTKVSNFF